MLTLMQKTPPVPSLSPPTLPCSATTHSPIPIASEDDHTVAASFAGGRKDEWKCWNYGDPYHGQQHWKCPAKGSTCSKFGKKGHYARLCRGGAPGPVSASVKVSNPTLATVCTASSHSLSETTIIIKVGTHTAQALIDSGSSDSFTSDA